MRKDWRQGLRPVNMRIAATNMKAAPHYPDLVQTILGKFPKLEECFGLVQKKGVKSRAFSRNFNVLKEGKLEFKGRWVVGDITPDKKFNLLPAFDWTRELLEEELVVA